MAKIGLNWEFALAGGIIHDNKIFILSNMFYLNTMI